MKKTRGTCIYRVRGMCYYNPPSVAFVEYKVVSVHPPVAENDRCSKWVQHPKK